MSIPQKKELPTPNQSLTISLMNRIIKFSLKKAKGHTLFGVLKNTISALLSSISIILTLKCCQVNKIRYNSMSEGKRLLRLSSIDFIPKSVIAAATTWPINTVVRKYSAVFTSTFFLGSFGTEARLSRLWIWRRVPQSLSELWPYSLVHITWIIHYKEDTCIINLNRKTGL